MILMNITSGPNYLTGSPLYREAKLSKKSFKMYSTFSRRVFIRSALFFSTVEREFLKRRLCRPCGPAADRGDKYQITVCYVRNVEIQVDKAKNG